MPKNTPSGNFHLRLLGVLAAVTDPPVWRWANQMAQKLEEEASQAQSRRRPTLSISGREQAVLGFLRQHHDCSGASLTEISSAVGYPEASVSCALRVLRACGWQVSKVWTPALVYLYKVSPPKEKGPEGG